MTTKQETIVRDGRKWIEIPNTMYGDYIGCTVERSNSEVLLLNYKHQSCYGEAWINNEHYVGNGVYEKPAFASDTQIIEVRYDYSSSVLFALESNEELMDIIASLADYPIVDEEHLSALEWCMQEAYVEDEIVDDILRHYMNESEAYCEKYDCTETELKDDIREVAWEYINDNNMDFVFEEAYCAYLQDTDEVIQHIVETLFTE